MDTTKETDNAKLREYYVSKMKAMPVSQLKASKKLAEMLDAMGIRTIGELTQGTYEDYAKVLPDGNGSPLKELSSKIKDFGGFGMTDEDWKEKAEEDSFCLYSGETLNEELLPIEHEVTRVITTYPSDSETRTEVRNADGKLKCVPSVNEGAAISIKKLSRNGSFCVHESFFDENENPMKSEKGWARFDSTQDEQGKITGFAYYDENGALVTGPAGYAKSEYNHYHNYITSRRWYDEKGKLIREWKGYDFIRVPNWASVKPDFDSVSKDAETEYDSNPEIEFKKNQAK